MNEENIFLKTRCGICKKRVATRLCDFIVDYLPPINFRKYEDFKNQKLLQTGDMPLCDQCAKDYNGYDFCPHHYKLLDDIKPTLEMQKQILKAKEKILKLPKGGE